MKAEVRAELAEKGVVPKFDHHAYRRRARALYDKQLKQINEERAARQFQRSLAATPPSVSQATADELIAAGWGHYERRVIPADWKTRRPTDKPSF